jgi:hypothetical protein
MLLVVACVSRFSDRESVLVQWCPCERISHLASINVAFRAGPYIEAHLVQRSQLFEAKAWSDQATSAGWAIIARQMGDLRVNAGYHVHFKEVG